MTSSGEMTILAHDPESRAAVPRAASIHLQQQPTLRGTKGGNVFVLTSAAGLPGVAQFVRAANQQHRLRALFIREDIDARLLPQMLERAKLRVLRNTLIHSGTELPRRVIAAWQHGAQDQLIATAQVVGDRLLVVSCALETFEVPFVLVPALRRIPTEQRTAFTISSEGSYIHWSHLDIHLDLDAFRYATDPQQRVHQQALRLAADQRFGAAIARLRKQRGLRQSDIAGLSERQVRRIEKGQRTTAAALELLAKSHGLPLNKYLDTVANAMNPGAI